MNCQTTLCLTGHNNDKLAQLFKRFKQKCEENVRWKSPLPIVFLDPQSFNYSLVRTGYLGKICNRYRARQPHQEIQ